jgi:arginyl-tRNA synthetase
MNGKDGKPFKTRTGGIMRLSELIQMMSEKAAERLTEAKIGMDLDAAEKEETASTVGIAALKFADLSGVRTNDYIFDLDKFSAFEGRTGPYLLYMAVRAKSILRKAKERGFQAGCLMSPQNESERIMLLTLAEFPEAVNKAFEERAPSVLCEFSYDLCTTFSQFYQDVHVLNEPNGLLRESRLALCEKFLDVLTKSLDLLGIDVPDRM